MFGLTKDIEVYISDAKEELHKFDMRLKAIEGIVNKIRFQNQENKEILTSILKKLEEK